MMSSLPVYFDRQTFNAVRNTANAAVTLDPQARASVSASAADPLITTRRISPEMPRLAQKSAGKAACALAPASFSDQYRAWRWTRNSTLRIGIALLAVEVMCLSESNVSREVTVREI